MRKTRGSTAGGRGPDPPDENLVHQVRRDYFTNVNGTHEDKEFECQSFVL